MVNPRAESRAGGAASEVRPLTKSDFDAVVALDRRLTKAGRAGYYRRRLAVALREPQRHLQLAVEERGRLAGFLLARVCGGEFGRPDSFVVLETIGVDPDVQHKGLALTLLAGLEDLSRHKGATEIDTHARWRQLDMLRFFDRGGFDLAPRQIVERAVDRMPLWDKDDDAVFETMPVPVRRLAAGDFEAVARIDRAVTNRDRDAYLQRKFDEVLNESAMEVSLVAEDDGLPVGFVMARVDDGEYGQVEAVATLDTIGVKPGFEKKGIGRALLTQLINNLAALHVERLETELARETFGLLGFLYHAGFSTSQRLAFCKRLG